VIQQLAAKLLAANQDANVDAKHLHVEPQTAIPTAAQQEPKAAQWEWVV